MRVVTLAVIDIEVTIVGNAKLSCLFCVARMDVAIVSMVVVAVVANGQPFL